MDIKNIKKHFMAYRNGIVADTLRAAGMNCYNVIFGLNLPQLKSIASIVEADAPQCEERLNLADALWADTKVRESRLLAAHIYGSISSEIDQEKALSLMQSVQTREEAEILCLRLLRLLPFASALPAPTEATPLQAHLQSILARHLTL